MDKINKLITFLEAVANTRVSSGSRHKSKHQKSRYRISKLDQQNGKV
jgi:hypothetical protein